MEDRVGRRWGINNFIGPLVYPGVPRFFFFDNGAFGLLARRSFGISEGPGSPSGTYLAYTAYPESRLLTGEARRRATQTTLLRGSFVPESLQMRYNQREKSEAREKR
ncbi:hypothetical protein K0M31_004002 [Melipona bicolor]|uniref:Uncharacterized protein n=1 Tax=Melipona bicolor TaxID=60889 RepID=A0AA40FYS1_9HYME|nr:hypothetical protein K0M31_004002 [Melipona bicolor]